MIVHMLKRGDAREYTTKCGMLLSKHSIKDSGHVSTVWHTEVSCVQCEQLLSSKEILVGQLAFKKATLYNKDINQQQELHKTVKDSAMARKESPEIMDDAELYDGAEPEVTEEKAAKVSKKAALPDGWITPVSFAHALSARDGAIIRPQIIYGYIKNSKDFPHDKNTDGRVIVHSDRSFEFVDGLRGRKAEREAAKAAKAAEAPAAE